MTEVGEFVRTNDGHIGKLIRIERDDIDTSLKWYVFDDGKNERYVNKPYIVNHSKDLIDLIEVGDYVNGYKVIAINKETPENCIECIELDRNNSYEYQWISKNDIETILTKEQYTKNCYTVERKEEQ